MPTEGREACVESRWAHSEGHFGIAKCSLPLFPSSSPSISLTPTPPSRRLLLPLSFSLAHSLSLSHSPETWVLDAFATRRLNKVISVSSKLGLELNLVKTLDQL